MRVNIPFVLDPTVIRIPRSLLDTWIYSSANPTGVIGTVCCTKKHVYNSGNAPLLHGIVSLEKLPISRGVCPIFPSKQKKHRWMSSNRPLRGGFRP